MKRTLALAIIMMAMVCGCAQRYDGSTTASPAVQASESDGLKIKTPQPTLDTAATGGPVPTPAKTYLPTPQPSATPEQAPDANATAGLRTAGPQPTDSAGTSNGSFPAGAVNEGMGEGKLEGGEPLQVGNFAIDIPPEWEPMDNYELDYMVRSVDGVHRFAAGECKVVVSAVYLIDPIDLDKAADVEELIGYNTSYEWMEYISHDIIKTPLGKAVFWRVDTSGDAPYNDEAYVGMAMLLPTGSQALNLGISLPERASDEEKEDAWRMLGRLAGTAEYIYNGTAL